MHGQRLRHFIAKSSAHSIASKLQTFYIFKKFYKALVQTFLRGTLITGTFFYGCFSSTRSTCGAVLMLIILILNEANDYTQVKNFMQGFFFLITSEQHARHTYPQTLKSNSHLRLELVGIPTWSQGDSSHMAAFIQKGPSHSLLIFVSRAIAVAHKSTNHMRRTRT